MVRKIEGRDILLCMHTKYPMPGKCLATTTQFKTPTCVLPSLVMTRNRFELECLTVENNVSVLCRCTKRTGRGFSQCPKDFARRRPRATGAIPSANLQRQLDMVDEQVSQATEAIRLIHKSLLSNRNTHPVGSILRGMTKGESQGLADNRFRTVGETHW